MGPPPPPPEERRRARSEPTPEPRKEREEGQAGGGAGGAGGGGGGAAGGGGRVAGRGGGDPGGSDDSEPEGDDRRAWKRYTRHMLRKQEKRMMEMVSAMMSGASSDPTAGRARDPKAPQPSKLKGEAHDVDRFLRQCENVFTLEASSFRNEGSKIRYTGNLLEGSTVVNWYEAYHNLIDQGAANRAAGRQVQLDPHWLSWARFTFSFRQSFGDRVTREEAVAKWDRLIQTAGIDAFLDKIVQLMWKTGYSGEVVDDQISKGLGVD